VLSFRASYILFQPREEGLFCLKVGVPKLLVELFLLLLESKKAEVPFRMDWKMFPFDSFRTGLLLS